MQNDAESQRFLRAKSARYDAARRWWWAQAGMCVFAPTALALLQLRYAVVGPVGAAWTAVALVFDAYFETQKERRTVQGAMAQDGFDRRLFGLHWNRVRGAAPGADDISRWAGARPSRLPLADWYAPAVGALPEWLAPLVCHAINAGWDREMRHRQAALTTHAGLAGLAVFAVVMAAVKGSFAAAMLVVATVAPVLAWVVRDRQLQLKLGAGREALRQMSDDAWGACLSAISEGRLADARALARRTAEELQYEVFMLRRDSQPLLEFLYFRWRLEDERAMRLLVEQRVAQYDAAAAARASSPPPAVPVSGFASTTPTQAPPADHGRGGAAAAAAGPEAEIDRAQSSDSTELSTRAVVGG